MNILHVSCSPRGRAAESYRLSQKIVGCLLARYPRSKVLDRAIGGNVLPHVDADYAISQGGPADISQEGSAALSEMLIRELEGADIVVIGTPVHNFTVPSSLKAWIDHVVRVRRTFDTSPHGKIALLHDRPVFIAASSGGRFSGEHTRQPDFFKPYLTAALGIVGLRDLTFFSVEGTGAGPDAVEKSRIEADRLLQAHASFRIGNG